MDTSLFIPSLGSLYYKGNIALLQKRIVGIVGTRKASEKGLKRANELSKIFSENNYAVLSGLARGIDTEVHKASINNTIAVIPTSLDKTVYPKENEALMSKIIKNGGLVLSPFKNGSNLRKYSFVYRDKVQSLLSSFIIVVESSLDGGSMHALKNAVINNRKVYIFSDEDRLWQLKGTKNIEIVNYDEFLSKIPFSKWHQKKPTYDRCFLLQLY